MGAALVLAAAAAACTSGSVSAGGAGDPCAGVDLQSDPMNCGACGNACSPGLACSAGVCGCPTGQSSCGGACVDTSKDASNCGKCGNTCPAGEGCGAGVCGCATGETACAGACVDTSKDASNCGDCGKACGADQTCVAGACQCATGKAECGGACVDTQTDAKNCGGCGKSCGADQTCVAGACQCATGKSECGGACVDTQTDANNCGACGKACGAGQTCCGGACADTQLDGANCGACGTACSGGQACSGGKCACGGVRPNLCGTTCTNLTSDTDNCGACGSACSGATPVCSNGSCVASCNTTSGQTACGSQCVTLGNDPNNCGACGTACKASEICSGGTCTAVVSISPTGCADGTREFFTDATLFPNIAACAGGWDGNGGKAGYTGVFPAPLRTGAPACAATGNSDATNPTGKGCSSIDLCASGWHICAGGEVSPRATATGPGGPVKGCDAQTYATYAKTSTTTPWPDGSFFAAAIGSTGCYQCALTTDTVTGPSCTNSSCQAGCQANPGLTNDIFGCGGTGALAVDPNACDVNKSGNNVCANLGAGWSCGTDGYRESVYAAHDPSVAGAVVGGVLCCRDM